MKRVVVDTNVPIVANGRHDPYSAKKPSYTCRLAAVEALLAAVNEQCILLDLDGAIQAEYRGYFNASGQPGVGDQFYLHILRSIPGHVERRSLAKRPDGEYAILPQALIDAGFDTSDRKFAALAKQEKATVLNATDSDWLIHSAALSAVGIEINNLCGCQAAQWFES
jgi:hypothetical protein